MLQVPYVGKYWRGKKLANLANLEPFANILFAKYFRFRNTGKYFINFEIDKMVGLLISNVAVIHRLRKTS